MEDLVREIRRPQSDNDPVGRMGVDPEIVSAVFEHPTLNPVWKLHIARAMQRLAIRLPRELNIQHDLFAGE